MATPMKDRRAYTKRAPREHKFTEDNLKKIAADLQENRIPLDTVRISDDRENGLRAIIRNTGLITLHVQYEVAGKNGTEKRGLLKIGEVPGMTIERARSITRTVKHLGDNGIDPTEGLHERLIKELEAKGTKWRP